MTWNDISVKKWIKISQLGDSDPNDIGTIVEIISIINDMTFDEVKNLPINEAVKLKVEVEELLSCELKSDELLEEFKIGDIEFKFADLQKNWILAKNIDLQQFSQSVENFHITLAILYFPHDVDYETDKAIALSRLIEDYPIGKLYSAWSFFFLLTMDSVKITGNYSLMTMGEETLRIMTSSMKNPDRLLPTMRRLLLKKLKVSGLTSESLTHLAEVVSKDGSTPLN